ncbi:glycosyltransferase involved in cell wall biosynthesis [Pseudomonas sp. TE3786]
MKVSIITVCYNSSETIRTAVESVIAQDYPNIEYIVIDGGSKDGTPAILDEYRGSIDVLVSEPDRGIYDAMNKGVALATGDIVGLLNSDDLYESPTSISEIVAAFERSPQAEVVFGDVVFVASDDLNKVTRYYSSRHFRPWKLRFGWMPPHPATFVRQQVYQRLGNYSLAYKISADYEVFVRWLLVSKLAYKRLDRVVVRMRAGGASTAGVQSSIRLNREIVQACRSNGVYTNLFLVLLKTPFKLLELMRKPKAPSHG